MFADFKLVEGHSMMTLDEALAELRRRNEPVPRPTRLPTEAEVADTEAKLGVVFHPDYRRFLLEASDVVFNVIEPATITKPDSHADLLRIAKDAREVLQVPSELVPICMDNADFYCMTPDGRVIFWTHDSQAPNGEEWPDLATWIEEVWMFDYDSE